MSQGNVTDKYKDRLFTKIFGSKDKKGNLLSLYNALNNTNYTDENALEITTIENVIYMGMHNDVSCIIDNNMALYEHQSTFNPNMPLRGFMYAGKLYSKYISTQDITLYGSTLIPLPTPQYYVLYNGTDETDDRVELRLSDSFSDPSVKDRYEWTAVLLNINYGRNRELMEKCRVLSEYAQCVSIVREHTKGAGDLRSAIRDGVDDCISRGILREYLLANKAEVVEMLLTEYNEQKTLEQIRRESEKRGREEGLKLGKEEGLKLGKEEGLRLGKEEGLKLGEIRALFVISKLIQLNRQDEINLINNDPVLLDKLAEEFRFEQ